MAQTALSASSSFGQASGSPSSSFTTKRLRLTLTIASHGLGRGSTRDRLVLEGYRCQVAVTMAGLQAGQSCSLRLYGLPLPVMNRLSLLAYPVDPVCVDVIQTTRNTVLIEAGDDEHGLSVVYYGTISEALADFGTAPEPCFEVYSHSVQGPNATILPAQTYRAGMSVADIMASLCAGRGYGFVNHGLNVRLKRDTYLHGTLSDQLAQLYEAYKFIYRIGENVPHADETVPRYDITVWSRNLADIPARLVPRISAATGLVGYPSYSASGVALTTLFDPRLAFMMPVQIESDFLPAAWVNNQSGQVAPMPVDGAWLPILVTHTLDSEIPGGRWLTHIEAVRADRFGLSLSEAAS